MIKILQSTSEMQQTFKYIPQCTSVPISSPSIGCSILAQAGCGSTRDFAKTAIQTSQNSMNANPIVSNFIPFNLTFIMEALIFMDMVLTIRFVSFPENASMISLWSQLATRLVLQVSNLVDSSE